MCVFVGFDECILYYVFGIFIVVDIVLDEV